MAPKLKIFFILNHEEQLHGSTNGSINIKVRRYAYMSELTRVQQLHVRSAVRLYR